MDMQILIPIIRKSSVEKVAEDPKVTTVEKRFEIPDWNEKVYGYKMLFPTGNSSEIGENMFLWENYEFRNKNLLECRNHGESLVFDGDQKAQLEKRPADKKINLRQKLQNKMTFLVFCQNGLRNIDKKSVFVKGEPIMEYDCNFDKKIQ